MNRAKEMLKDLKDKGLLHHAVKTYFETGSVERMVEEADREFIREWRDQ